MSIFRWLAGTPSTIFFFRLDFLSYLKTRLFLLLFALVPPFITSVFLSLNFIITARVPFFSEQRLFASVFYNISAHYLGREGAWVRISVQNKGLGARWEISSHTKQEGGQHTGEIECWRGCWWWCPALEWRWETDWPTPTDWLTPTVVRLSYTELSTSLVPDAQL